MKLVLLSYLEGRLSLYSTFIKLIMMSSVLLLLPYSLLKEMEKAKKKRKKRKYLWLNSLLFFCKTDLDLVLSKFLSWNLHYKKKKPEKLLNAYESCFFIIYILN